MNLLKLHLGEVQGGKHKGVLLVSRFVSHSLEVEDILHHAVVLLPGRRVEQGQGVAGGLDVVLREGPEVDGHPQGVLLKNAVPSWLRPRMK